MSESQLNESPVKADIHNARDLQALLYREIGISAVAAALEVKLDCPAVEPVAIKREIPAILRDESLAA